MILMTREQKMREELNRVVRVLIKSYGAQRIILFGSLARDEINDASDVDLVIIKMTDKKFVDRIGEVIDLCRPRVAMDFIVYTPEEFDELFVVESFIRDEVMGKGKILYDAAA